MTDFKNIELNAKYFLRDYFDKVLWLSENSYSPIDFKCFKGDIPYMVECKYISNKKCFLSPNQKRVDAVVTFDGIKYNLIWRKDFNDTIVFSDSEVIKINSDIKKELDLLKIHKRQSYSDVIKNLINNKSNSLPIVN